MQTPGTTGQPYRSTIRQFGRQQHDDHNGSSSDQLGAPGPTATLSAQYERCPLIPCMPELTKGATSLPSQQPISELAGLHAALSNEGVQLMRSPTQQQPPQQPWQQAQSPLRSGLQQHRHSFTKQQSSQADDVLVRASQTSEKLGQVGDELFLISSRLQDMGRSKAQHQSPSAALLSELATGNGSPAARKGAVNASASYDAKFTPPELLHRLREELTSCTAMVMQRARGSCSPDKPGTHRQGYSSGTGSASTSSKASSADQPLQQQQRQAGAAAATQQQQQELLGLAGSSSKASAAAAALAQRIASSEALRRLQHPQQQQPASKPEVAQVALQQVQDLTELSQILLPGLQAQHAAVAECQQKVGAISSVLQKHPQLANPAAIQSIVEKNQKLEGMLEALRRENQAKDLAHMNTLNVLRENTATPRDRRLAQLQHENLTLHQKLMSRDAQMQRMQGMLVGRPQQQGVQQQSSGELSPVAAEGQRYDEVPAARQVHRSLWGPLNGQGYPGDGHSSGDGSSNGTGSCTDGTSRSCTPSSGTDSASVGAAAGLQLQPGYQQQRDLSPSKVSSITAQFERQMAAGRTAVPQMQQQLNALRSPNTQPGIFTGSASLIRQPGEQYGQPHTQSAVQPTSGGGVGTSVDNLKAQVQQQWSALDQQQQQFAGMRASLEASHKRQLETERRQRETTQQQCELWKGKTEELVRQLTDARAQVAAMQQQQALSDRRSTGSGSASGSSGGGAAGDRQQQQQQQQRLLQESVVRELQGQLSQARQEKEDLQAQLDQARSENAVHKAEIKKQVNRLQLAEQALLDYQSQKDQAHQFRQRNQDLQQQLARVQEAAAAAEGTAQECRRQLAAADSEKAVLMDRIRQLADRASNAESRTHRSRSGDSSADALAELSPREPGSGGSAFDTAQQQQQQQQQQLLQSELSATCAELNQQVVVLRGQLVVAQGKEERLQVTNASLQERLSRLQAEYAAKDASASNSRRSSSSGSQPQQQQVQELLQQVADLQQQLAAATTARAAASAAVAVAGGSRMQQQAGDTQEQQAHADALQEEVQQLQAALEDRTLELQEWQIHADALEKDLEDLKAQVLAAEGLQGELEGTQAQLAAARSQQQQLQQDLEQARGNMSQLKYELHGLGQERTALRSRVDVLTAELAAAREGSADLRLRLEHFTGPGGPQARVKQLEAALQLAHRKLEAAETRAANASSHVTELTQQLGGAEDQIVALEGHISVLEEQLAAYTQLPQ